MVHGAGILLLTAVAGYWVLERAEAHKGDLRRVGKALGWIVIVGSLVGVACRVYALATGKALCPPGKGFFCPYTPQSSATPSKLQ
jgi:hypothetical protein